MLLIDDLLAAPWRGLVFVLREIENVAREEQAAVRRDVMAELSRLHRRLDQGEIGEAEFAAAEEALLDRLDHLNGAGGDDASDDADG